jgi:hypothetical protein
MYSSIAPGVKLGGRVAPRPTPGPSFLDAAVGIVNNNPYIKRARMAGSVWRIIDAGPVAPGTLDEARRQGLMPPASSSPGPQSPWRSRVLVNDAI